MRIIFARLCFCAACVICLCPSVSIATEIGRGPTYSVIELTFRGPAQSQHDTPARDIDFWVRFQHESGSLEYKIHGFWDGDGKGGSSGDVFVVRFCPTKPGRWNLAEVQANVQALVGQRQGDHAFATISALPGFWIADPDSPGRRWHMRSDGSHQYIMGNTHYTFLTGRQSDDMPSGNNIADAVIG
ncbi:DUF5060 domain-containing protein, partial [Candidatus Sumerlaeota bacterium]|nr:DUF5060 domain-containing protein [Candidatus Sumerlaeota bacterium]